METIGGQGSALLVCADGRAFHGRSLGAIGSTVGEGVFFTGMTGYEETLTDPSYHRQIVVMTAPHIGNTGITDEDAESARVWVSGFVVRNPARTPSNWRSRRGLHDELVRRGVVGIAGVDTRAVTRHLRDQGAMRMGIAAGTDVEALLAQVRSEPPMAGRDLTAEVTTKQPYVVPGQGRIRLVALDFGIKTNIVRELAHRGADVHVLPATATLAEITALRPDGVLLSNGPGDPSTAHHAVEVTKELLRQRIPLLGICFGHQILGRALGFPTYKLVHGHRGVNHPVLDRTTGQVEVTCHNHGFAVSNGLPDNEFGRVEVSHVSLNDNVVEGLRCLDVPAFSVQHHPEAAAGPHDAKHLFDRFLAVMHHA